MSDPHTLHGHDPLLGTMVAGRYRVQKLLGEGGMGQVYLAVHEAIEKQVALKVLRPEYSRKEDIVTRFQQEAISASRIKHPNVLDVFDFGQTETGCFFLAMEFLEGHDLSDELERHQRLSPARALTIALQICKALATAHGAGVVHRDLKPENVFLQRTPDGDEIVKIVDFGIAQLRTKEEAAAAPGPRRRLTRTGMIFGTPEYMAPEQAAGKKADLRVDVYALGVMLYEMLTGAVPFTGETFMAVLAAHLNDPVPPMRTHCPDLAVSPELEALVTRMLAKSPDQRCASMAEVAAALRATPEDLGNRESALPPQPRAPMLTPANPLPDDPVRRAVASAQTAAPDLAQLPPARSSTELGAEAPISLPKRSLLPLYGLLVLLLVGGGVATAALLALQPPASPPLAEPLEPSAAPPPPPSALASTRPPPAPSASAATVAPTSGVRLDVETDPPGAVLLLDGAQVCDATPCPVYADQNETVELKATKGNLVGVLRVRAQREQKVTLKLAPQVTPGPLPTKAPPTPERLCTKFDPDLEITVTVPCPR